MLRKVPKSSRAFMVYIVIVPILGMLYYRIFTEGRDYSALYTSAILLYCILLYGYMASIDPLTSLLTRLVYNQQIKNKKVSGVVSADVNGLKAINDSEGHEAGDLALKPVAEILKKIAGAMPLPIVSAGMNLPFCMAARKKKT